MAFLTLAFCVSAWAKLVQGTAEAEGLEATVRPLDFLALLVRGFTLFLSWHPTLADWHVSELVMNLDAQTATYGTLRQGPGTEETKKAGKKKFTMKRNLSVPALDALKQVCLWACGRFGRVPRIAGFGDTWQSIWQGMTLVMEDDAAQGPRISQAVGQLYPFIPYCSHRCERHKHTDAHMCEHLQVEGSMLHDESALAEAMAKAKVE